MCGCRGGGVEGWGGHVDGSLPPSRPQLPCSPVSHVHIAAHVCTQPHRKRERKERGKHRTHGGQHSTHASWALWPTSCTPPTPPRASSRRQIPLIARTHACRTLPHPSTPRTLHHLLKPPPQHTATATATTTHVPATVRGLRPHPPHPHAQEGGGGDLGLSIHPHVDQCLCGERGAHPNRLSNHCECACPHTQSRHGEVVTINNNTGHFMSGNWNEYNLNPNEYPLEGKSVPAAAVIPAPITYI
jgi:hypothetical protein